VVSREEEVDVRFGAFIYGEQVAAAGGDAIEMAWEENTHWPTN
jgi:hypothetical protein